MLNHISEENKNLIFRQFEIEVVTRCSYCKRYQWADGEYRINAPTLPIEGIDGNISDAICPECIGDVMEHL
jgi:hypothetical protein